MAISTVDVTARMHDQNGQPLENCSITVELTDTDRTASGTFARYLEEKKTNENGVAVFSLVPNSAGLNGTKYKVTAVHPNTGELIYNQKLFTVQSSDANLDTLFGDSPVATEASVTTTLDTFQTLHDTLLPLRDNINTVAGLSAQIAEIGTPSYTLLLEDIFLRSTDIRNLGGLTAQIQALGATATLEHLRDVAAVTSSMRTVAGMAADVATLAVQEAHIASLAPVASGITTLAAVGASRLGNLANATGDIATLAPSATEIRELAPYRLDIDTVASIRNQVQTVATIQNQVSTVAGSAISIVTLALRARDLHALGPLADEIRALGGATDDLRAVANETRYIGTAAPTADNDGVDTAGLGRSFTVGARWIDTTNSEVYTCTSNATGAAVWVELSGLTLEDIDAHALVSLGLQTQNLAITSGAPRIQLNSNDSSQTELQSAVFGWHDSSDIYRLGTETPIDLALIHHNNVVAVVESTGFEIREQALNHGGPTTLAQAGARSPFRIRLGTSAQTNPYLNVGHTATAASIQATATSTTAHPLVLNPFGGNVGIGNGVLAPTEALHVRNGNVLLDGADSYIGLTGTASYLDMSGLGTYIDLRGAESYLQLDGDRSYISLAASNSYISLNGSATSLALSGSSSRVLFTGASSYLSMTGQNSYLQLSGTGAGDIRLGNGNAIRATDTRSTVSIAGGDADNKGANIILYGQSHTSSAHDWAIRRNQTNIIMYDDSDNLVTIRRPFKFDGYTSSFAAVFDNNYNQAAGNSTVGGLQLAFSRLNPDNNSARFILARDQAAVRAVMYSDGDWQNHDNSYGGISDERLKTDIVGIFDEGGRGSYWDEFRGVRHVKYRMLDDVRQYGKRAWHQIGAVAQQVEQIFPGLIKTDADGMKGIKYSILHGPIMACVVQEAQGRIEELERRFDGLENQKFTNLFHDVAQIGGKIEETDTEVAKLKARVAELEQAA